MNTAMLRSLVQSKTSQGVAFAKQHPATLGTAAWVIGCFAAPVAVAAVGVVYTGIQLGRALDREWRSDSVTAPQVTK